MGIKHAYQSATANDGAKEVSSTRWNEDHTITGELTFPAVSSPTTPAANNVNVFGRKVGGRMLLGIEGPSGLDTSLQPFLGRNAVALWQSQAGGATAPTAIGIPVPTATGTATSAATATTNRYTRMRKTEYLVTTAATTAVAGWRAGAAQWTVGGASAGDGGFFFVCRFGPATGVATSTNRCYVGMSTTSAPTDVEPSTITNSVGAGWDAADTNIQIMHRGASAITKVDTGIVVPSADRASVYELAMFSPPGTTQTVGYEFTDLVGGTSFAGTISANMPSTTTLLAPKGWMSAGGTSSVIGIALMSMYLETDY